MFNEVENWDSDSCTLVFMATLFVRVKIRKTTNYVSIDRQEWTSGGVHTVEYCPSLKQSDTTAPAAM